MDNIYIILDKHYNRIGTLDLSGATPFSNDSITIQLADADSSSTDFTTALTNYDTTNTDVNINSKNYNHYGQITVAQGYPDSNKIVVGNHLAYFDDNSRHWYVMRIYYTSETGNDISGRHTTTAQLENIALFDLGNRIPEKKTMEVATLDNALGWLTSHSQWEIINNAKSTLTAQLSFDGVSSAWESLQTILQAYDIEMDCYVVLDSASKITRRIMEVTDHLNEDKIYQEAAFGRNTTEVTRNIVESQVVTKLYVYGQGDNVSIASVNDGKPYIVDDNANEKYNADYVNTYREKSITSSTILNRPALLDWGRKMLSLYNHPRYNYVVTVSSDFNPPIGTTIRVKDQYMNPEMTVEARVIQKTISKANPFGNTIMLGEFVTVHAVTPAWIMGVQSSVNEAVAKAKENADAVHLNILTPDGTNFTNSSQSKRLILQALVGKQNITGHIDTKGFEWHKINTDGTMDKDWNVPALSTDFSVIRQHENLKIAENHATRFLTLGQFTDFEGALSTAIQYFVVLSDGSMVLSVDRQDKGNDTSFFWVDKAGRLKSSMIVTAGGHGSTFGAELINGIPNIWTLIRKSTTTGDSSWIANFSWQANKRVNWKTGTVIKYCEHNRYMRIGYDARHGYVVVGYSSGKGTMYVCDAVDIKNNTFKPKYTIQQEDFGIDTNGTFQSQTLDFPYLYICYGDYGMKERRKVFIINVETQELVTEHWYSFYKYAMGDFDSVKEPEGTNILYDGNTPYLIQGFNTTNNKNHYIFKIPISISGSGKKIDANLNGYLLNLTQAGKLRASVETGYLQDEPEVVVDESSAVKLKEYKHPGNGFDSGDYACQYAVKLADGTYMTSHHYQGSDADYHKNDTMYMHWDANFNYIDRMILGWGGHGSSFGVDTPGSSGEPWIWASVVDYDTNKYYIAHFKYKGRMGINWKILTDDYLELYGQYDAGIRINYDNKNKLVGVSKSDGGYEVLDVSDVVNNAIKPLNTINIHDYGFDSANQTYQSQVLDYPYLYWQSGDYDMHDLREMFCVNVVTGALEFTHGYEFQTIKTFGTHWEPEAISILKDTNGDKLLVSFNFNDDTDSNHTESFWTIPISYRKDADQLIRNTEGGSTQ